MKMHRTQLYLDDETRRLATWEAAIQSIPLSEVLRRAVKSYIRPKAKMTNRDFVKWIEELNKKYPAPKNTPGDLGLEHDHYLYGTPKKYRK
jgi:hypothetical protein